MRHLPPLFALLGLLLTLTTATAPTTFCKCTCFKNYTIIPLGPEHQNPTLQLRSAEKRTASSSCSKCTKSFCRDDQNLPFCKDATDEDIQTMCFQRDSNKDRIIVWGFLLGTTGMLGWAAFKKIAASREARNLAQGAAQYVPVGGSSRGGAH